MRKTAARQTHLSMSHWAFVLMGLHLGFHIPAMAAKLGQNAKKVLTAALVFLENLNRIAVTSAGKQMIKSVFCLS